MRGKIFLSLGIIFIFFVLFFLFQFSPTKLKAERELFIVGRDVSGGELIEKLSSQGFVRNPKAFKLILKIKDWKNQIEPGGYLISKSMSAFRIAKNLTISPSQKWVVIPEGLRKEEIAEILQQKLNWQGFQKRDFLERAEEGYLFPDTYLVSLDYSGQEVADRMNNRFNEKVANLFKEAEKADIRNDSLIILASLIQREGASEEEMPLIAGIIWNRWFKDMNFGIDATIQYILGEPENWWPIIKPENRKIDSPYNTYLYKGKPPAPICNPGLSAVRAVIEPEKTDYLYYLHDENRKIHCAKTYQEHLINIEKYLK